MKHSLTRILQIQPKPKPGPIASEVDRGDESDSPSAIPDWRLNIMKPLEQATMEQGLAWKPEPLVLGLIDLADPATLEETDPDPKSLDSMEGGLIGQMLWQWLRIEILAVPKRHRGLGLGTQLMALAEAIAWERGCRSAWVDTFSFQAPKFYEKLGYRLFGELPDYPPGEKRSFYCKSLAPPANGKA